MTLPIEKGEIEAQMRARIVMESMPKSRISVTVEQRLVEWVDSQIETLRFRNRSHAVEYALAKLKESESQERVGFFVV